MQFSITICGIIIAGEDLKGMEKKQEMSGNSSIIKQINIILIHY